MLYRIVWGVPALVLLLGVGLWLSVKTRWIQFRLLPRSLKHFFRSDAAAEDGGGVSPFRALCTALAATVGTGNLAGVAGALTIGGPGAIFWMWICGFLGMALKFAEATLAVRFREQTESGEWVGGPMHMIRNGLPGKKQFLAGIYSIFGIIAAFGVGNATQISTMVAGINDLLPMFGLRESARGNYLMGLLLAVIVGFVLFGGAKRIGRAAELLVPFAAGLYLVLGVLVLVLRFDAIPAAFACIIRGAFRPRAVTGGVVGSMLLALRTGISRGVFTNEAGMGTASMAHASAQVRHPVEQGMMGIVEVFVDTIVICTMTALVILCSGVSVPYGNSAGIELTGAAFSWVLGPWVRVLITASLCLFAFATVLAWGLYGLRCSQYLFGTRLDSSFLWAQLAAVLLGAVVQADAVWLAAEIVNGLMAIPNLFALLALRSELQRLIIDYYGGHYENLYQRQSLRILSHAHVPPAGGGGQGSR